MLDSAAIARRSPQLRSKLGNRSRMFGAGVDARSSSARRFRDLIHDFATPLGGYEGLAEADAVLVREVAAKTIETEALQSALANGERVDSEQSVRISNTLARLLAQLERRRKALTPKPPSLAEYAASRTGKAR